MKVLNALEATLPNAEVHAHLVALIERYASHPDFAEGHSARLRRLYSVCKDVVSYFDSFETRPMSLIGEEIDTDQTSNGNENNKNTNDHSETAAEEPQSKNSNSNNLSQDKSNPNPKPNSNPKSYDLPPLSPKSLQQLQTLQSRLSTFLTALQSLATISDDPADKLTKAEALMLINVLPVDEPVLECVVEEVEERYAEQEREEIMRLCRELGGVEKEDEEMDLGDG